jgi:hypothetical protein
VSPAVLVIRVWRRYDTRMRKLSFSPLVLLAIVFSTAVEPAAAEPPSSTPDTKQHHRVTVLTGLHQPILLKGANLAAAWVLPSGLYLEMSFGFALDYGRFLSDEDAMRYDHVKSPLTGGIGVGYWWRGLAVALEPKISTFEIAVRDSEAFDYAVYTLGIGLYYDVSLWRGLVLQPTLKYWPTVATSLDNDRREYLDGSGQRRVHEARQPGRDGLIVGVSLGWSFEL